MPPAPSKKPAEVQPDEGVQAVVLCDVFSDGLAPLNLDTPVALMPIAGVPSIEYTLQFLADNGIVEVLLFCAKHVSQLRRYLEGSRWAGHVVAGAPAPGAPEPASPRIRVLTSGAVSSSGDALRAVDSMGVLRSDAVVLVDGPVVANFRLQAAIQGHLDRAKADSNAILTVLVTQLPSQATHKADGSDGPAAPQRSGGAAPLREELRLTLNQEDGRIVAYDIANPATAAFPPPVAPRARETDPKAVVRADLADARVYVASHEAFIHFTDNYDYQCVRRHYIHNEVLNVDMGFRFNAHLVAGHGAYAGVLCDARALAAISADVAAHRCAPYAPSSCWWAPSTLAPVTAAAAAPSGPWSSPAHGVWVQAGARVSPQAQLLPGTAVFAGASVEAGARVAGSIVGASAVVGAGAVVTGAILMRGALVGSDARVTRAILGAGAVVGAGCSLPDGCILGSDVVLSDSQSLPAYTRLTCAVRPGFEPEATPSVTTHKGRVTGPGAAAGSDIAAVGPAGVGRLWPAEEDEMADSDDAGSDSDDDSDDGSEGGSWPKLDPKQAGAAVSAVRAALRAVALATRAQRVASGGDSAGADVATLALSRAIDDVANAVRLALAVPLLSSSPGIGDVEAATRYLAVATQASRGTAGVRAAPSGSAGVAASAGPAGGAPSLAAGGGVDRFFAGVREILTAPSVRSSDARSLAMEVKSFRFSENRTSVDCIAAVLPIVLDHIPRDAPKAFVAGIKSVLAEWRPLLEVFDEGAETERAAVDTAQAYVLQPANAGLPRDLFGVIVSELWELEITTDTAITEWLEGAEESEDPAVISLLAAKWTQWLLQQLDEDEDEDEDEEDEGDEDEEE